MGWLMETGRVVAVEADAVWIEADRSSACGRCAARAGCGQGALSKLLQQGKGRVRALSGAQLCAAHCARRSGLDSSARGHGAHWYSASLRISSAAGHGTIGSPVISGRPVGSRRFLPGDCLGVCYPSRCYRVVRGSDSRVRGAGVGGQGNRI